MALWGAVYLSPNLVEACCCLLESSIAARTCCGLLEGRVAWLKLVLALWERAYHFWAQQVLSTFPASRILEGSSEAVWRLPWGLA